MNLEDFGKWSRRMGKRVSNNADVIVRKCALAVDASVVLATPVDTGRARANWQVDLNDFKSGTVEPTSSGGAAAAAIAQGRDVISRYKGGTSNAAIFITNNLSYIGRLNNGWSAQAPAGFVERAIMVGREAIRNSAVTTQDSERR